MIRENTDLSLVENTAKWKGIVSIVKIERERYFKAMAIQFQLLVLPWFPLYLLHIYCALAVHLLCTCCTKMHSDCTATARQVSTNSDLDISFVSLENSFSSVFRFTAILFVHSNH